MMLTLKKDRIIIRDLSLSHLSAISTIERDCFEDPWPDEWFLALLQTDIIAWGAFRGHHLAGYLVAMPSTDHIHLANIVVSRQYRRQGIARTMVRRLYEYARRHGQNLITLEVRQSNHAAIAFYKEEGFELDRIAEGYYRGKEDALVFNLELN